MSKNVKIAIAVILVVLVVIVLCCCIGKKEENSLENEVINEIVNETEETNTSDDELILISEKEVDNNQTITEEIVYENVEEVKEQGTIYETDSEVGTTDKKQQAIDLVKQKWGEDDTVTFRCDSINSSGEYIIAVISKQSASVKNYFKVNLDTQTVEIDY